LKRAALLISLALLFAVQPALAVAKVQLPAVSDAAAGFTDANPEIELLFRSALLNPLGYATQTSDGTVYVETGNIRGEWLRDSSAEVRPYLYFAADPEVRSFLKGVIARQARYITLNPYANRFSRDYRVLERKYELDSLCYPILLAWTYWKVTGDASVFTPGLERAFGIALKTMWTEQRHHAKSRYRHRGLPRGGRGRPTHYTGMIWTGYRPSDDPAVFNYVIPSEMMAVQALGALSEIEAAVYQDQAKSLMAAGMRAQVNDGIQRYGVVHSRKYGRVYAYEVDGLGNSRLIDDANLPSLLSAPYVGYVSAADPVYQDTRRMVLSSSDPYYFGGAIGAGIGSSHTPRGFIWPLALVAQALTATTADERQALVTVLLASDPGDHLLHESFDPDDATALTRKSFVWPNSLFSELILTNTAGPLPTPSTTDLGG
jgi:meiotically up-regulated gene 157 (Mug157) protein